MPFAIEYQPQIGAKGEGLGRRTLIPNPINRRRSRKIEKVTVTAALIERPFDPTQKSVRHRNAAISESAACSADFSFPPI